MSITAQLKLIVQVCKQEGVKLRYQCPLVWWTSLEFHQCQLIYQH